MSTTGGDGGLGLGANETIGTIGNGEVKIYKVCVIPDWQIEKIADAVVRKLKEKEEVSIFKPIGGRGVE